MRKEHLYTKHLAVIMVFLIFIISTPPKITEDASSDLVNEKENHNILPPGYNHNLSPIVGENWSEDIQLTFGGDGDVYQSPKIAVEGDFVHVVYYNYTPGEIYYKRSVDGGRTWEPEVQISHSGSNEVSQYPCIVANGSNVYIFWHDTRDPLSFFEIYMAKSNDSGRTWLTDIRITPDDGSMSWNVRAAIWGDNIYIVWDDDYYTDREGKRPETFFSKSMDAGETWTTPVCITPIEDYVSSVGARIAVWNQTIHIAFAQYYTEFLVWEAHYMRSDDGGNTWTPDTPVTPIDGWNSQIEDIACNGTTIHITVADAMDPTLGQEVYYYRSIDNGNTWSTPFRLSIQDNEDGYDSRLGVEGNLVFVCWSDCVNWTIHYRFSQDAGATWSPDRELVPIPPPISSGQPSTVVKDNRIHVVFVDNRTGVKQIYYKRSPSFSDGGVLLSPVWNLISLPGRPPTGFTSRDLARSIENTTGYLVLAVHRWNKYTQSWEAFIYRDGTTHKIVNREGINNMLLSANESYLIQLNNITPTDHIWNPNFPKYNSTSCPGWDLMGGWNSVALPYNTTGPGFLKNTTDVLSLSQDLIWLVDWNETTNTWDSQYKDSGKPWNIRYTQNQICPPDWNWNGFFLQYNNTNKTHITIT